MAEIRVGQPHIYRGIYHYHWETGGWFVFRNGRRFLGLFPMKERWLLRLPSGFSLPDWDRETEFPSWEMEIRGIVTKKGRFGEDGEWQHWQREAEVEEVLFVKRI
jgi:hypothetical protein